MLCDTQHRLEGLIVETLAHNPSVSALWLQERIKLRYRAFSIQAVYQELRKLRKNGVVVKVGENFSLRTGWVLEVMELSDSMYDNYLCRPGAQELFPEVGQKNSWQLPDLYSVGAFCSQLVLSVIQHSGQKMCFEYAPHAWYHLCPGPNEAQFLKALELTKCQYFLVVGSDSYLDKKYNEWFSQVSGEIAFGHHIQESTREQYSFVCGDFIGTIKLPSAMRNSLDSLFMNVRSDHDVQVNEIMSLFRERIKGVVSLSNNPDKARRLQKRFKIFFGLKK